jgi:sugar lactone lactonase YvrE
MRDPNALGGRFMNVEDSQCVAARLGISALLVLGAGCNGGAGAPPTNTTALTTQIRTATSPARTSRKLYVSTIDGGSVVVYSADSNPTLLQTITEGAPRPGGIWVDKRGVLYAVNVPDAYYQTSLPEYKPGASSPYRTITDGIVDCDEVAVDSKGKVYVTGIDTANGSFFLEIYPKGRLSPSETLTIPHADDISSPAGLAFDSTGALLVGESSLGSSSGAVYRLPAGSQTFTNLNLDKAPGGAIAIDAAGNLYVGGGYIAVYPPNSRKPVRTIVVPHGVSALALGSDGELYVGSFESVLEYAPHAKNPTISFGIPGHVGGLALSP